MTSSESDRFYLSDADFPDFSSCAAPEKVRRILYFRIDGIGDAVLANPLLGVLKERYPESEVTVVCDNSGEAIFRKSPHVGRVLAVTRQRLGDWTYFSTVVRMASAVGADLSFNLVRSNPPLGYALSMLSGAPVVLVENDCVRSLPERKRFFESRALRVLPLPDAWTLETETNNAILEHIGGAPPSVYGPELWLDDEDRLAAGAVWREAGFTPERTLVLFASGGWEGRDYLHFGDALGPVCRERGLSVIALGGGERETMVNEYCVANLLDEGVPALNLSGRLTITASAALLADCRMAVGTETGLAHIACALGVPQLILLGGGHFGRFMPYSPLTTALSLPLECFCCNWRCRYPEPYCVKAVSPAVLGRALEAALEATSDSTARAAGPRFGRVLLQSPSNWRPGAGQPRWRSPQAFINWCRERGGERALDLRVIR